VYLRALARVLVGILIEPLLAFPRPAIAQDGYAEAVRWYSKSAEQGHPNARYDLGYMYYNGYGVPKDPVEANRLFHEAAAQGNERARQVTAESKVRVPATSKIMLPLKFLASLYFGVAFLKSGKRNRTRAQTATGVAALLLICAVALDLFWRLYVGHLQSSATITLLYLVRHLVHATAGDTITKGISANTAVPEGLWSSTSV
jgi:hypothetical protein